MYFVELVYLQIVVAGVECMQQSKRQVIGFACES